MGECKSKMHTLEEENSKLQWAVGRKDERIRIIESENMEWRRRFEVSVVTTLGVYGGGG